MATERIFHVCAAADWAAAQTAGIYRQSTRGQSLDEVGFIHCSFADQVERIGALLYGDEPADLVVLVIDPKRVGVPVVVENLDGGAELFPHIYGAIELEAVLDVLPAQTGDGTCSVAGL